MPSWRQPRRRQDLADLLEQQFPGCQGSSKLRLLQASQGFHQRLQADATPGHHVRAVWLQQGSQRLDLVRDGTVVQPEAPVRVTVSNFAPALDRGGARPAKGGDSALSPVRQWLQHCQQGNVVDRLV